MARYLDQFSVLLFDMNGTIAFGHDRFGPDEDYFATYSLLGGTRLTRESLAQVLEPTLEGVLRVYDDPAYNDDFPSMAEAFRRFGHAEEEDIPLLERVFAVHEIGSVPPAHERFLRDVAKTHTLGIVSNICAHPDLWLPKFRASSVFDLFAVRVFSSEGRSIKPSPLIFRRALDQLPSGSRILFVGDSLERDVIPAKALGLSTAWIAPIGSAHPGADRVVTTLPDLANSR